MSDAPIAPGMRKRRAQRNGVPEEPPGFQNNPQPPAIIPTKDPDTVITLPVEEDGMTTGDRQLTQSLIQNKVLMDIAGLINQNKNTGSGIVFTPNAILTITCWNSVPNQALTFQCWYVELGSGILKPIPNTGTTPDALENMYKITDDSNPNYQYVTLPATGGTIISFMARIGQELITTYRGETLVKAEVDNYGTMNDQLTSASTQVIVYNYADSQKDVTYPSTDAILVFQPNPTGVSFQPKAVMTINAWNSSQQLPLEQGLEFQVWYYDPTNVLRTAIIPSITGIGGASNGAVNVSEKVILPSTGGTIVSASARCTLSPTYRGQTLVKMEIDNLLSGLTSASTTQVIMYGYVYTRKDLTYPADDSIQDPVSGEGYIHNFVVNESGPGFAAIELGGGANLRVSVRAIYCYVTTGVENVVRKLLCFLRDPLGNNFLFSPQSAAMSANNTYIINIISGYASPGDASFDMTELYTNPAAQPLTRIYMINPITLLQGYNITITVANGQADDTMFVVSLYQEEWIEPNV